MTNSCLTLSNVYQLTSAEEGATVQSNSHHPNNSSTVNNSKPQCVLILNRKHYQLTLAKNFQNLCRMPSEAGEGF